MNGYRPRMLRSLLVYWPFDDDVARNNHVRKDEQHCQPCLPTIVLQCALASRWISQWTSPHFRKRLLPPKRHDWTSLERLPFVSRLSFLRKCKETSCTLSSDFRIVSLRKFETEYRNIDTTMNWKYFFFVDVYGTWHKNYQRNGNL